MTKIKILRKNEDGSVTKVFETELRFVAILYIKEAIASETTKEDGKFKIKIQTFDGSIFSFVGSEDSIKNILCNIIKNYNL